MSPARNLPTIPQYEIEQHNTAKSCYVTIGERVFDVTDFIDDHPGGGELILEYGGKDVKQIMNDEVSHFHTEAAYEILDDSLIGFVATSKVLKTAVDAPHADEVLPLPATQEGVDELKEHGVRSPPGANGEVFASTGLSSAEDLSKDTDYDHDYTQHKFLDLNKPLLPQMLFGNFSKEFYLEQVHRPRHYKGGASAPLFGNFLEPLSLTSWYVIPIVWLPPVAYGTYLGFTHLSNPVIACMYWAFGLFLWTLVEYVMHRFLFHVDYYMPDNSIVLTIHFLLHGVHHYLPMDKYRLVMPPALFITLATPFWKLIHAIFSYDWYAATMIFSGGIFGYVCYDCTHYWLHHNQLPAYVRDLKKYHLAHHYQNFELGFGVTSKFWDKIWGTELEYAKPVKAA